ncbi:unnamed protein product [Rotaria sordida]|uniref:Hermes trasposase DNA-binding domain-containing protein n=1 Tax=Rotaria sordida TaxID=392033 RepID=A0A815FTQ9_9BILA|nr:unnamed protein product [Rotaria sordida]CAF4098713.1 unnamed protein product [Rotaria sordida]
MSSTNSTKSTLSKAKILVLVTSNDPSISFKKPTGVYHQNIVQDYIICLQYRIILKWISENGTRVMSHHNCLKNKSITTTPSRQRTISSYCQQPSSSKECSLFQKRIIEACVEYCAVDGRSFGSVAGTGFMNLAKQLINAGATLGTSVSVSELLSHPSTISMEFLFQLKMYIQNQLLSFYSSIGIHYGGLSLHYIDAQSHLRVFTLACQAYDYETQHAINIRSFVNKILEEFGLYLNGDIFIVTDNENKMKCDFKDDVKRIGCSAHYISKILQHAFTYDDIQCDAAQLLFKLARAVVTKVRQCRKQSLLSTCLQNYCDTRFNSIYLMFDSFLKVHFKLPTILNDEQKSNYLKIEYDDLVSICL